MNRPRATGDIGRRQLCHRGRLWLLVAALGLVLAVVAGGCGGDEEAATTEAPPAETEAPAEGEPIKFGVLSTCEGPFAVFYALSKRGGIASGSNPSDGMSGASVAGHRIEVVLGCSDATPEKAVEEARRLVEAEFCALGGEIEGRAWVPLGEQDLTSYIAQLPEGGADGFLMALGGTGTVNFVKQYGELRGSLADKMIGGSVTLDPTALGELGDRVPGVVTGGPVSPDSTDPAWIEYVEGYKAVYTDVAPRSLFAAMYYDAAEAALQSLEAIGGDLSDGHAAFRETMSGLTYESPHGTVTLDANRNAIADIFVFQAVEDQNGDGVPDLATLKAIPQVDQTFAGFFSEETPTPDRESPESAAGTPPPWTSGG